MSDDGLRGAVVGGACGRWRGVVVAALAMAWCARVSATTLSMPGTPSTPSTRHEVDATTATANPPTIQRGKPAFEAALGLVLSYGPAFAGASDVGLKPSVAGFIRYGRFTLTGPGGFTTRRNDEVQRGLAADVFQTDHVRVNVSLRMDGGRRASSSPQLAGLGDIDPTLRMRWGVRWTPSPGWAVAAGTNLDLLGRVGGAVMDAGVSHVWPLTATSSLSVGAGLTAGSRRTMQAWHGVTAEQAAASGYASYAPAAGMRDANVAWTWRKEWPEAQWALFTSASASRLLGPAAASPLALQRNGWRLTSGLARRF